MSFVKNLLDALKDLLGTKPERQPAAKAQCGYLFDAGAYGGIQFWCDNSSSSGMLGQGSRIPLADAHHIQRYCKGQYTACPLYKKAR